MAMWSNPLISHLESRAGSEDLPPSPAPNAYTKSLWFEEHREPRLQSGSTLQPPRGWCPGLQSCPGLSSKTPLLPNHSSKVLEGLHRGHRARRGSAVHPRGSLPTWREDLHRGVSDN